MKNLNLLFYNFGLDYQAHQAPFLLSGTYSYQVYGNEVKGSSDVTVGGGGYKELVGAQLCIRQTWTATVNQRIATSVPIFWNLQVIPFEDQRLTGERTKGAEDFASTRYTETVTHDECAAPLVEGQSASATFGPFPDRRNLSVTSPNPIESLSHSLTVRVILRTGRVLELKVPPLVDVDVGPYSFMYGLKSDIIR